MTQLLRHGGAVNRLMPWPARIRRPICSGIRWDGIDDVKSTVFVIGHDSSVRESLERLVSTAGWEAECFPSAEAFLSGPRVSASCCVILEVTLPGLSGLDLQARLAGRRDMPLIFMTSHADVRMAVQAMKAGAVEFLTKPADEISLLHAMRAAFEWSRAALRHDSHMRMLGTCYSSLTPREREVMTLVVSGLLNKQIGGELGISEITVKAHRGQVMRKMGAESLPHLVTLAAELGVRHTPSPRRSRTVQCGEAAASTGTDPVWGARHLHHSKELR